MPPPAYNNQRGALRHSFVSPGHNLSEYIFMSQNLNSIIFYLSTSTHIEIFNFFIPLLALLKVLTKHETIVHLTWINLENN